MTVTVNATATATSDGSAVATVSSTNLTVASGATSLLVWLCLGSYSVATLPTSITVQWDSTGSPQTMTSLGNVVNTGTGYFFQVYLFGLLAPTVGNKTLAATWTTSCLVAMDAIAFNGTATDTLAHCFPNFTSSTGNSASATVTGTSAVGNINVAGQGSNNAVTSLSATGSTSVFLDGNNFGTGGARATGASTVAWTGATAGTNQWAICCVDVAVSSIQPYATISATGTTLATAAAINSIITLVTSTPASSGVGLLSFAAAGTQIQTVINSGANPLSVYAPSGVAIGLRSAGQPVLVPVDGAVGIIVTSSTSANLVTFLGAFA